MEPHVATPCVAGAFDAATALDMLSDWGVARAQLAPGLPPGRDLNRRLARWEGRLLVHHSAFEAPGGQAWNLAAEDAEVRRRSVASATDALKRAADLGSPCFSLLPGEALFATRDAAGRPLSGPIAPEKALDQLCRSLDTLASRADTLKLRLLVMNGGPGGLWADPETIVSTLERLAAPPLGLYLDVAGLLGVCHASKQEPEPVAAALAPHVGAVGVARGEHAAAPVEGGVELAIARAAGAASRPIVLASRGLDRARLADALALLAAEATR